MKTKNCFCYFVMYLSMIVILFSTSEGLQCPSCTYLTSDAEVPIVVRAAFGAIFGLFQDKECTHDLKGPIPQIKEETCNDIQGQVSRCIFYKGKVRVTIPLLVTDMDLPLQLYQRECYHFKPANVPASGWHNRKDINEDKTVIQQTLKKASSAFEDYKVAKFEGQMQVCADTYCKDVSGVGQGVCADTNCKDVSGVGKGAVIKPVVLALLVILASLLNTLL